MKKTLAPGPWKLIPYQYVLNEPTRARIHARDNSPVVDDANPTIENARLIAAAPELLHALKCVMDQLTNEKWVNQLTGIQAMIAIDRAEGRA